MSDRPLSYDDAKWDLEIRKVESLENIARSLEKLTALINKIGILIDRFTARYFRGGR